MARQWSLPAFLVLAAAVQPAYSAPSSDETVRAIENRFVAPCCWRENLAVHDSPTAREMRKEIEGLAASGKSESEIVDYYVERYDGRILRVPRGTSYLFLLVTPFAALGAGGIWIFYYLFWGPWRVLVEELNQVFEAMNHEASLTLAMHKNQPKLSAKVFRA